MTLLHNTVDINKCMTGPQVQSWLLALLTDWSNSLVSWHSDTCHAPVTMYMVTVITATGARAGHRIYLVTNNASLSRRPKLSKWWEYHVRIMLILLRSKWEHCRMCSVSPTVVLMLSLQGTRGNTVVSMSTGVHWSWEWSPLCPVWLLYQTLDKAFFTCDEIVMRCPGLLLI